MNLPTPEDLERMTDAELQQFADYARTLELEARIALRDRLRTTPAESPVFASRPVALQRIVKALEPRDSRRTFSPLALMIAGLVALALAAPGLVRFASTFKVLVDRAQQQLENQSK